MSLFGRSGKDARRSDERAEPKLFADRKSSWRRDRRAHEPRASRPVVFTVLSWIMTLGLWGTLVAVAVVGYAFLSLDKQGLFKIPEREPGMIVLAADGKVLAERGTFFGDEVRLDELPAYVPQAVIAIEDRRFYSHFGVDPSASSAPGSSNFRAGHDRRKAARPSPSSSPRTCSSSPSAPSSANCRSWCSPSGSKPNSPRTRSSSFISIASITVPAPSASKRRRNDIFRKSARDVNLPEAAILAAVLKAPATYNPITHPERATRRARVGDQRHGGCRLHHAASEADRGDHAPTTVKSVELRPGHPVYRRLM